jgi:hypothetical protein
MRSLLGLAVPFAVSLALAACSGATSSTGGGGDAGDASTADGGQGDGAVGADAEGGGGDDGGGVTAAQACTALATADCQALAMCAPFLFQTKFADMASCVQRGVAGCTPVLGGKGVNATPAQVQACSQAIGAESCDQVLDNAQPAACMVPGTLGAGAACAASAQCSTDYCFVQPGSACGSCTSAGSVGESCGQNSDCQANVVCNGGVCAMPVDANGACSSSSPCKLTLACIGGTCQPWLQKGATCMAGGLECDLPHGLFCNPSSNKCETILLAAGGASCGIVGNTFIACGANGLCVGGKCVAAAADGAACDAQNGPPCMAGAACASGKCVVPAPAACK